MAVPLLQDLLQQLFDSLIHVEVLKASFRVLGNDYGPSPSSNYYPKQIEVALAATIHGLRTPTSSTSWTCDSS